MERLLNPALTIAGPRQRTTRTIELVEDNGTSGPLSLELGRDILEFEHALGDSPRTARFSFRVTQPTQDADRTSLAILTAAQSPQTGRCKKGPFCNACEVMPQTTQSGNLRMSQNSVAESMLRSSTIH